MATPVYDNSYRTTLICIDSYDDRVPRGRLYNTFMQQGIEFVGVIDLLRSMEDMYEQISFPQAFLSKRTFAPGITERMVTTSGENIKSGKLATFSVRLLFRQNASWQGSVTWCEGRVDESFRSVLELLFLMDSALEAKKI